MGMPMGRCRWSADGAAGFCQKITLERSTLADASVRHRVCGNRACATVRPSGPIRAAVAVCGPACRKLAVSRKPCRKLAVRARGPGAGCETYLGAPAIGHGPEEKKSLASVSRAQITNTHRSQWSANTQHTSLRTQSQTTPTGRATAPGQGQHNRGSHPTPRER